MEVVQVDVAVIGAGTAGLTARRQAEKLGARVVMIEDGPYGTTCARVGCMPSKLLIAAADVAYDIDHAEQFGIRVSGSAVDGRAVMNRVRALRDRFVGGVLRSTEAIPAEQRLRGRARFVGPTTLQVGEETTVEARAVVIATGSSPWVPPELEPVRDILVTNDNVFELEDIPSSIAVVGCGIIGMEIGQALHRLGARTSFFAHNLSVGPPTEHRVATCIRDVFGRELDMHLQVRLDAERTAAGCRLRWTDKDGRAEEAEFERVLAATGRRPNVGALGLDVAGLELDERGVPRFDERTMQCGDAPVFIAGDVDNDRSLLHEAADEGRIAGANAARYPDVTAATRTVPLAVMFTDPQVAVVGERCDELDHSTTELGEMSYEGQGRALVMAKNEGMVRIFARRPEGRLIGAAMFGPRVEHTAHLLAWAIQSELTVQRALEMPFYHPVVEEGIRSALQNLAARLKKRDPVDPLDLECGPGV